MLQFTLADRVDLEAENRQLAQSVAALERSVADARIGAEEKRQLIEAIASGAATAKLSGTEAAPQAKGLAVQGAGGSTLLFTLEQEVTGVPQNIGRFRLSASRLPRPQPKQVEELTIAPGESIPAFLEIERNGHDDLVTFTVDNLPHGVIIDNIGLSGVLIPKGEDERRIFLSARPWVSEGSRHCHAVANQAGRQTSPPVLLKVRKPESTTPGR